MALVLPVILSVLLLLSQTYAFWIPVHPLTFALVSLALYTPPMRALWIAATLGLLPDLFASTHFGLYPASATLVTALLIRFRHLVPDQPVPFALYAAIGSALTPIAQLLLLFLFDNPPPLSGKWILVELLLIPAIDSLASLLFAWGPIQLYHLLRKQWILYRLMQEQAHE